MRLETMHVQNFRSCYNTTIAFAGYLTLLVGENDAGKSNLIDAIRVSVPPVSGRTTRWFETDRDLSHGVDLNAPITIKRTYGELTESEDAFYTPALVDPHRKLVHTAQYLTDPALARRHRIHHTVGEHCVADPEPENRDRIAHVYLQPLRDAATALDSAGGNRLADVFRVIATQPEIAEFERKANVSLRELAADETAKKVVRRVQTHLTAVTQPVRHRIVDVQHRHQRLTSLARSLRLHMAADGLTPTDLLGSGLGYANLLFIATVVLELDPWNCELFRLKMIMLQPGPHPAQRRYPPEIGSGGPLVHQLRREDPADQGVINRVARQLGVGKESLRAWVKQAEIDDLARLGVSTAESQEIAELQREIKELRRANEILRARRFFLERSSTAHASSSRLHRRPSG